MKISVNDQELYTLTETQKKVIQNNIPSEIFDADMKRRLHWVLNHKYEQCYKELKDEWMHKLIQLGLKSVPLNEEEFAELVFSQPSYKNRSQRDAESVMP